MPLLAVDSWSSFTRAPSRLKKQNTRMPRVSCPTDRKKGETQGACELPRCVSTILLGTYPPTQHTTHDDDNTIPRRRGESTVTLARVFHVREKRCAKYCVPERKGGSGRFWVTCLPTLSLLPRAAMIIIIIIIMEWWVEGDGEIMYYLQYSIISCFFLSSYLSAHLLFFSPRSLAGRVCFGMHRVRHGL
jgi:hypothetical protein